MSRVRPARFVHVVYRTRRSEQMIKWYETVFDAKVQYQNTVLAFSPMTMSIIGSR
jgi:hypothetical protein